MKSELYTSARVTSIRLVSLLFLFSVALGSSLHWVIPKLGTEDTGGEQLQQRLALMTPERGQFQLQALDITGSGQTNALVFAQLMALIIGILIPAVSFRHGSIIWKAINGRLRFASGVIAATAIIAAILAIISCVIAFIPAVVATNAYNVDLTLDGLPGVWIRGITAIILLALTATGLTLSTKSGVISASVISGVVAIETLINVITQFADWDPNNLGWLPLRAVTSAVGSSEVAAYSIPAGMAICAAWAAASLAIGCARVKTYNL